MYWPCRNCLILGECDRDQHRVVPFPSTLRQTPSWNQCGLTVEPALCLVFGQNASGCCPLGCGRDSCWRRWCSFFSSAGGKNASRTRQVSVQWVAVRPHFPSCSVCRGGLQEMPTLSTMFSHKSHTTTRLELHGCGVRGVIDTHCVPYCNCRRASSQTFFSSWGFEKKRRSQIQSGRGTLTINKALISAAWKPSNLAWERSDSERPACVCVCGGGGGRDELRIRPHPVCTRSLTGLARSLRRDAQAANSLALAAPTHTSEFQFLSPLADIYAMVALEFTDGSACEVTAGGSFVGQVFWSYSADWFTVVVLFCFFSWLQRRSCYRKWSISCGQWFHQSDKGADLDYLLFCAGFFFSVGFFRAQS